MSLIKLTIWIIYGLLVGSIAKAIHPGEEKGGMITTLGIGIAGSFTGGCINWLLGYGTSPFQTSGIILGIIGGVVFLVLYNYWQNIGS
jgi:uncharacterized membrane protein YeaQ/YmgE (transglycosylase-associated protein family)